MEDKFNSEYLLFEDIYVNSNYNFWVVLSIYVGHWVFLHTWEMKCPRKK